MFSWKIPEWVKAWAKTVALGKFSGFLQSWCVCPTVKTSPAETCVVMEDSGCEMIQIKYRDYDMMPHSDGKMLLCINKVRMAHWVAEIQLLEQLSINPRVSGLIPNSSWPQVEVTLDNYWRQTVSTTLCPVIYHESGFLLLVLNEPVTGSDVQLELFHHPRVLFSPLNKFLQRNLT